MPMVRCGNIELNVVERGRGTPIVLAHGFPLDHSMWNAQIDHLATRYRVIAPDLRGFGRSQVVPGVASMEQMADDLAAMLDTLGIADRVVFCGLSMGGYVAFQFWRKYRQRLRALVLCDTRSVADTADGAAGRRKTAEQVLKSGTQGLADGMMPKLFAESTVRDQPQLVASVRGVIERTSPQGVAAALEGLATRPDVTGELAKIDLPTLLAVGEHDAISSADEMSTLAKGIPNAEFRIIPWAGHMAPLENPTAFHEALDPFLHRVD